MTNKLEIYRCEICGNIVQVLHKGADALVCCNKPMTLLKPQTNEVEKQEKHVPIFIKNNEIQIGSIPHPMTKEHHIEFLQTISENTQDVLIHFFNPQDEPKVTIKETDYSSVLEYCNLHGLWQGNK